VLSKTFKGGVHLKYYKELTENKPIRRVSLPQEMTIPLLQHAGAACVPTVKPGDFVETGMLIADSEKLISAPIHSPVSGKVKAIKKTCHPVIGACSSVVIIPDGKDEAEKFLNPICRDTDNLSSSEIITIVRRCGIVGLGGAAFPTHIKLSPPKDKHIDTFILNGAECEPFLTCDDRMMQERPEGIIKGALLIMKAVKITKGIIAIEDNKPRAISAMQSAVNAIHNTQYAIRIITLRTKYPQGGEKQLIKAILGREVPPSKLPFDVGCIVENVQTAYAIYEAVYCNKPLYEKAITITGDAIAEPANLLVKVGTPVSHIVKNCGGIKGELGKLIIGGPMMGIAQYATDVPVVKAVSGILALSRESTRIDTQEYCIRCGKCKESCPVNLIPTDIAKAAECGHFDIATTLNATDCIECGCCSYVCPSHIPLVQLIKHAKRSIACQI
jgi:electron transport complex protein RnfC